jgi:low temperature requirement protein LtrA
MIHKLFGLHIPMPARDHREEHRVATPLELFYDLVVVIAVAFAATAFHHSIAENHIANGLLSYVMVFWSIWWAWMSFTWFASSYDTDDAPYRIAVFFQLLGSLILAAGVDNIFEHRDFTMSMAGYVIMRIALVALWLRVIKTNPKDKIGALRYAVGISACQFGWVILILVLPSSMLLGGFLFLLLCEHFVPFYADFKKHTKWHRHHVIERFGLMTIIVLGESLLSSANAIKTLMGHFNLSLLSALCGGLLILFSMWWLYFDEDEHPALVYSHIAFIWGYGHFFVFAAIAATGAGLAVVTEQLVGHANINSTVAVSSVAIPVAIYLLALWFVHDVPAIRNIKKKLQFPIASALILLMPFSQLGVLGVGTILVLLLIVRLNVDIQRQRA